jgi:hypothetical protein
VVLFGANNSKIQFFYACNKVCLTRLEKSDKDKFKKLSKLNMLTIVDQADEADFIVTNKLSATIKILYGIVTRKKILRPEYFEFLYSNNYVEKIPDYER